MQPGTDPDGIRINKYIASTGFCSRRDADKLIEEGHVSIDGVPAVQGSKVMPGAVVTVKGRPVVPKQDKIYIAFHKPLGITCTTDRRDPDNIIDYIGYPERIFPVGRLDKNSSGLILLTNDGDIVNQLLRAENGHEKEYTVTVDRNIDPSFKSSMENGLPILGQITLPCKVSIRSARSFNIILKQGLNRQIRRMCEYLGYRVIKLRRIRFMNIELGGLKAGEYRLLEPREIEKLLSR